MHQSIGEYIRQARRQHNLTQTELGGSRFSKSYVSAVERSKIEASSNALLFFAEQLGLSSDYFANLLQQPENIRQLSLLNAPALHERIINNEELALLDMLLESTELYNFSAWHELPTLSLEVIASLPSYKQARYYFLMGRIAQEKGELSSALQCFEAALGFAPTRLQVAILNELGVNHYLAQAYMGALRYHLRALDLLQKERPGEATAALQFKVHFNCGNDYRALGAYEQACEHYELARMSLNPEHDIKTAALLYRGLGYCTYASIHQRTAPHTPASTRPPAEAMDREFQRAADFYLQSHILYQVSGNSIGAATTRLAFALAKLDLSTRRRQVAEEKFRNTGIETPINITSFLDEAEEQCRQVLLNYQYMLSDADTSTEIDTIIYVALAYLVRVYVQRATLGRLRSYADTALRERILAARLCQQVLDTLSESTPLQIVIQNALNIQAESVTSQDAFLPRITDTSTQTHAALRSTPGQIEVHFAAGEVAEELGRAATRHDYMLDCYAHADQCFQAALNVAYAYSTASSSDAEPGYLVRCYHRCISILEERSMNSPVLCEETTRTLLNILTEGLHQL